MGIYSVRLYGTGYVFLELVDIRFEYKLEIKNNCICIPTVPFKLNYS